MTRTAAAAGGLFRDDSRADEQAEPLAEGAVLRRGDPPAFERRRLRQNGYSQHRTNQRVEWTDWNCAKAPTNGGQVQ
jgi:hypothetical protein